MGFFVNNDCIVCYQCDKSIEIKSLNAHTTIESIWHQHASSANGQPCARVALNRGPEYAEKYGSPELDNEESRMEQQLLKDEEEELEAALESIEA